MFFEVKHLHETLNLNSNSVDIRD